MKHTLKSLLITSILTLPTVFGAGDSIDVQDSGANPLSTTGTVSLNKIGQVFSSCFVGEHMIDRNSVTATDSQNGFNVGSEGVLWFVHNNQMYNVIGVNPGFLNLNDIQAMATVSKAWYGVCKNILSLCKAWALTHPIPRLIDTTHSLDTQMMKLLTGLDHLGNLFGTVSHFLTNTRIIDVVSPEILVQLDTFFSESQLFDYDQKRILKGLLPNALTANMIAAGVKLRQVGCISPAESSLRRKYHNRAAELYLLVANRKDATPGDIQCTARGFSELGKAYPEGSEERGKYHQQATRLFLGSVNHTNATLDDIQWAAFGFEGLGDAYQKGSEERLNFHKQATELYMQVANHKDAQLSNVKTAALDLSRIAETYPKGSPERLNFHKQVSNVYILAAYHKDASTEETLRIAMDLRHFAETYPKGSPEREWFQEKVNALHEKCRQPNT